MKTKNPFNRKAIGIFIIGLMLSAVSIKAQSQTNFTGKWELDTLKSKLCRLDLKFEGTIILEIEQNKATIAFDAIYKRKDSEDWKSGVDTYNLDGKEKTTESRVGTEKRKTEWSADKKKLIITVLNIQTREGKTQEYLNKDTYSLSDDGLMLTMESYFNNPITGELNSTKVYHKR